VLTGWTSAVQLARAWCSVQYCTGEDMAIQARGQSAERRSGSGRAAKQDRTTPALFVRQVTAELRKVVWPTRNELLTYTVVALVFIIIMSTIVLTLDYGFTKLIFWVFG
jgi:preprotein translocase subunit SecE